MADDVTIRFKGDSKGAVVASKQVKSEIDGLGSSAQRTQGHFSSMASSIGGTALKGAALGIGGLAALVGVTGIKFDNLKQQSLIAFTTMLGSAQKAQAFMDDMQKFAATTPFEFPDLIRTSQTLLSMGFAAKEVKPTLTALGDAMSGLGRSNADLNRAALILGQIRATGHLMGGDMLQLQQLGINVRQALVESTGKTMAEVQKAITSGAVSSQLAIDSVTTYMEKRFGGLMEKQSHTFGGLLSTLKDTFTQISGAVMAPFFELATSGMQKLVDLTSGPGFTAGVQHFADVLSKDVSAAVSAVVSFFQAHWPEIESAFQGAAAVVTDILIPAIVGIVRTLDTVSKHVGGWGNLIEGIIGGVVGAIVGLKIAWLVNTIAMGIATEGLAATIKTALITTGIGAIAVAAGIAAAYVITHWDKVKGWFETFSRYLHATFNAAWATIVEVAKAAAYAIAQYATAGVRAILEVASHLPFVGGKAKAALHAINDALHSFKPDFSNIAKAWNDTLTTMDQYAAAQGAVAGQMFSSAFSSNAGSVNAIIAGQTKGTAPVDPNAKPISGGQAFGTVTTAKGLGVGSGGVYVTGGGHSGVSKPGSVFDCSGYVYQVFTQNGFKGFPGSSETQYSQTDGPNWTSEHIPISDVKAGDVVFATGKGYTPPGHVGFVVSGSGAGAVVMEYTSQGQPAKYGKAGSFDWGAKRFYLVEQGAHKDSTPPATTPPATVPAPTDTTLGGGTKTKPKVNPLSKPATLAAVADTKKALKDVSDAVADVPSNLRGPIDDALGEASRLLKGLVNKGELATAKKDIAAAKADIVNALSWKDTILKARDDIALLSKDLADHILPPAEAKKVRDQLAAFAAYIAQAGDHISKAEAAHLKKLGDALAARAKAIADDMAAQRQIVKDALDGFAQVLSDAAASAGILIQKVYKPADIELLGKRAALLTKALEVHMTPEARDAIKAELADVNSDLKAGLDELAQNVTAARAKVDAAWGTFADHVLADFDRVRGAFQAGLDDVAAALGSKQLADSLARAQTAFEKAAGGGDPHLVELMGRQVDLWREYYKDLAAQNFAGAKELQGSLISSQDAIDDYLASLPDDQRQAAQAIIDAGGSLLDAIKQTGEANLAAQKQSWDDLTVDQRKNIEAALADAQSALDAGTIMLPEALGRVRAALVANGMSPEEADKLLHDPITGSLNKAVTDLGTAIGILTGVLVALATALGIAVPDIAKNAQAGADALTGPYSEAANSMEGFANRIAAAAQSIAQSRADAGYDGPIGGPKQTGASGAVEGFYNGGIAGLVRGAYAGMQRVPGNRGPVDNVWMRTTPGEMIITEQQQARLFAMANGAGGRGSSSPVINLHVNGSVFTEKDLVQFIREAVQRGANQSGLSFLKDN